MINVVSVALKPNSLNLSLNISVKTFTVDMRSICGRKRHGLSYFNLESLYLMRRRHNVYHLDLIIDLFLYKMKQILLSAYQ